MISCKFKLSVNPYHLVLATLLSDLELKIDAIYSGGSRNFGTGGRGTGGVEFLSSDDCFVALPHIPYAVVVRNENKTHIVNIVC